MAQLWRGFVPQVMEEKWFAFFEDGVLHLCRSWTGIPIFRLFFAPTANGWHIARAEVNRRPEQHKPDSTEYEIDMARGLVRGLLDTRDEVSEDVMATALAPAAQPGYLGSPEVVGPLMHDYVSLAVQICLRNTPWAQLRPAQDHLIRVFTGEDAAFHPMPQWHTADALGASLVELAGLDAACCADEPLAFIVDEALAALMLAALRITAPARAASPTPYAEIIERIHTLIAFARDMFLGTAAVTFPGATLKTLAPEPP